MHPFLPKLWNKIKVAFNVAIDVSTVIIDQVAGIPIVSACTGALGGLAGNVLGELISNMPEDFLQARREKRARLKKGSKVYEDLASGKLFSTDNCPFASELDKIDFFAQAKVVFDECEIAYEKWEKEAKKRKKQEKRHEREARRAQKRGQLPPPIPVKDENEIDPPDIPLSGSDGRALVALFTDYMYKENIEKYLKLSKLYSENMVEQDRELLLEMLNGARESFLRSCYASDLEQGQQVLLSLFREILDKDMGEKMNSLTEMLEEKMDGFVCGYEGVSEERLEEMFEGVIERALSTRLAHLGADTNGEINLSEISSGAFSPKYLARKCPDCSYSGERLYFNEASGEFHCSACGLTYSVMKGLEEEAKILGTLDALKTQVTEAIATTVEHLSVLEERTEEMSEDVCDIHEMATQLVETVATQKFLQDCMDAQGTRLEGSLIQARDQIGNMITSLSSSIKELVLQKVEELSTQINETGDRIVSVVESECAKLHAQNVTIISSLSTLSMQVAQMQGDIMAMRQEARNHRDEILNVLLTQLGELKAQFASIRGNAISSPVCFSQAQMCEFVSRSETALCSYSEAGTTTQDVSRLLMGISVVSQQITELENKIVSKIPTEMRLDKGDTQNPFACPYCGVVRERGRLGDRTDRFKCSACGNKGFRINPFATHEDKLVRNYGRDFWRQYKLEEREIDEILEMPLEIERWRDAHKASLTFTGAGCYKITFALTNTKGFPEDKVYFITIDAVRRAGKTYNGRVDTFKEIMIVNLNGDNPMWDEESRFIFYSGVDSDNVLADGVALGLPPDCKIYTTNKSKKIK